MIVTRAVVLRELAMGQRTPSTTAHAHVFRFYREAEAPSRRPSWVERIACAPSPFAVEGLLADFGRIDASAKARQRVAEVARVRICELRGVLP